MNRSLLTLAIVASFVAITLAAPSLASAQEEAPAAPAAPAAAAPAAGETAATAIPRADACEYPVELLWHKEPDEGPWQMGVSVVNRSSGQQVPALGVDNFEVVIDNAVVSKDEGFEVAQSAAAFALLEETTEDGQPAPKRGVDPVNYDVYFAVDLTASMDEVMKVEGAKDASRRSWALRLVQTLVQPSKKGTPLFDKNDRVYISGFTQQLETSFMSSTTADRSTIRKALAKINEFAPTGDNAALYASIMHNLDNITAQADQYKDAAKKREAVLIVLTDSWNGMDLDANRSLRSCGQNDELTGLVQQRMLAAREATAGALKVYLLAMGQEGETERYSLTDPPDRRCRILDTQKEFLDGRSMRLLGQEALTRGGYLPATNPVELLRFVKREFEALKSAYEVKFIPPPDTGRARSFLVRVIVGDKLCADDDILQSNIIPQAMGTKLDTTPGELALFLAGLIIALFFLPRSLSNVVNLGGGGSSSAPSSKSKKRKKKRR